MALGLTIIWGIACGLAADNWKQGMVYGAIGGMIISVVARLIEIGV